MSESPSMRTAADLAELPAVAVKQKKELLEVFTDFESANKYVITDPDGAARWMAFEKAGGPLEFALRWFLKAARPFTIEVRDPEGALVLKVVRPWRWIFAQVDVFTGDDMHIGTVVQRWTWFGKRYDVVDPKGRERARVTGRFFRPWTFPVWVDGKEVGQIGKRWGGLGREMFTDADSFGVSFGDTEAALRAMLIGATFLLDFKHFEGRD